MMMNNLFSYSLEVTLSMVVFYLAYHYFLRNETNYQLIRGYLTSSLLVSFVLPLISIGSKIPSASQALEAYILPEVVLSNNIQALPSNSWTALNYTLGLYGIGVLFFVGRFVHQFFKLNRIRRQSKRETYKGISVYSTSTVGSTFSFLNSIYLDNKEEMTNSEKTKVLDHEWIHIQQRHSLDVLISEVIKILFWFNPIVYFFQDAIKMTHEYIADQEVVKHEHPQAYINLLVHQALSNIGLSLGNHFGSPSNNPIGSNKSKTLRRIEMMKKRNQKMKRMKYLVPVFALAITFAVVSCDQSTSSTLEEVQSEIVEFNEVDQKPSFNGGMEELYAYIGGNMKYPTLAKEAGAEGKTFVQFVIGKDGTIDKVKAIKTVDGSGAALEANIQEAFEAEALRVVSEMPAWEPGKINDQFVSVKLVLPIAYKLD